MYTKEGRKFDRSEEIEIKRGKCFFIRICTNNKSYTLFETKLFGAAQDAAGLGFSKPLIVLFYRIFLAVFIKNSYLMTCVESLQILLILEPNIQEWALQRGLIFFYAPGLNQSIFFLAPVYVPCFFLLLVAWPQHKTAIIL